MNDDTVSSSAMESWEKPDVDYLTHVDFQTVVVAGREVPHLTAMHGNDRVHFSVNGHGFDCHMLDADHIAGLIAHTLAVGAGFVGWPDADGDFVTRPFAPLVHLVGEVKHDD